MRAISIRRAGHHDLFDVQRLAAEIWRTHYPGIISLAQIEYMLARMYSIDALTALTDEPGSGIALAYVDAMLTGFAAWIAPAGLIEARLDKLYIASEHQRKGIGGALMAWVAIRAREQGARTLILNVNKNNPTARNAYLKHGFTVRASAVIDIGGGFVMDDYVMARAVSPRCQ